MGHDPTANLAGDGDRRGQTLTSQTTKARPNPQIHLLAFWRQRQMVRGLLLQNQNRTVSVANFEHGDENLWVFWAQKRLRDDDEVGLEGEGCSGACCKGLDKRLRRGFVGQ